MKIAEADILIVPGLSGAPAGHWQRRWIDKMANAQLVDQQNWSKPDKDKWVENLKNAIIMATRPVVLVGHSVGVATIAHAAQDFADTKVRGALLVAPIDPDGKSKIAAKTATFKKMPREPFSFPSLVIASSNDPYCTLERAADFASAWGSEFHNAGEEGHFTLESGHGPWPDGLMMFTRLMQRIKS